MVTRLLTFRDWYSTTRYQISRLFSYRPHWTLPRTAGHRLEWSRERHVHHTVGDMIWSTLTYDSRSSLFVRGNIAAHCYVKPYFILYSRTFPNPIVQQDNVRPQVARLKMNYINNHQDFLIYPQSNLYRKFWVEKF